MSCCLKKPKCILIIPGVPSSAALAPVKATSPPSFKWSDANLAAINDVHTLCFHINSEFEIQSKEKG